ncbi:MAG: histidine kinase dimerization/phospho-acceptor domain-containing protein, partial [Myxococcota bacterium]
MSIRKIIIAFLVPVTIITITLNIVMFFWITSTGFHSVEAEHAGTKIARTLEYLDGEMGEVEGVCRDYASWNATYDFIEGHNPKHLDENVNLDTFLSHNINFAAIYDTNNTKIWSQAVNLVDEKIIDVKPFDSNTLAAAPRLFRSFDHKKVVTLIMDTDRGPMLLASCPVVHNDYHGPVKGHLLTGKLINGELKHEMEATLGQKVTISFVPASQSGRYTFVEIRDRAHDDFTEFKKNTVSIRSRIKDPDSGGMLEIQAEFNRPLPLIVEHVKETAIALFLAMAIIFLVAALLVSYAIFNKPVVWLSRNIGNSLRSEGAVSTLPPVSRWYPDEIKYLAGQFNTMVNSLNNYMAGMRSTNERLSEAVRGKNETELALKENEDRLATIVESVGTGVMVFDPETLKIIFVNGVVSRLTGMPKERIIGQSCGRFFTEGLDDGPHPMLLSLGGEHELAMLGADGRHIPVLTTLVTVAVRGRTHFMLTIVDISQLKHAQDALARREALEKIIMEISTRFVNLPSENIHQWENRVLMEVGQFIRANRGFLFKIDHAGGKAVATHEWCAEGIAPFLLGFGPLDLANAPWWKASLEKGETTYLTTISELSPDMAVAGMDLEQLGLKSLFISPIMRDKKLTGFFGFSSLNKNRAWDRDEIGLMKVLGDLFSNAMERIRFEGETAKAMATAEAASRSKSEFLANMSHEIRTPLNGVIGMLNILLESKLSDEQREYVETAANSSEMLLRVISDILDFSKIEAGKMTLEERPFDLEQEIIALSRILMPQVLGKGLELSVRLQPDTPRAVLGDKVKL